MDKEETHFMVESLVTIHMLTQALEELHESLTDFVIQKGAPNVQNPDDLDIRRN